MRTINRRKLNQFSGRIIDRVLATAEPVEVTSRGKGSVVISRKPEVPYARWVRDGLVLEASEGIDTIPPVEGTNLSAEVPCAEIDSDH